ncbi:MAG TPA: polysaccharide biosynthesis/export family protein [Bryobacteraceae bacterium]|nr:polysaccharide biosynthesis/export family protein [Bryobacteraceae bacterium]
MKVIPGFVIVCLEVLLAAPAFTASHTGPVSIPSANTAPPNPAPYVLGPEDQITIRALHVDEIGEAPLRIGSDGYINLALAGRVHAAGLTVSELEQDITQRLHEYVLDPEVTITVTEFHSQPVSVLGAVKNPGIYQVQGHKTLSEMLSLAGGLDQAAGSEVKITRELSQGPVPLPNATTDSSGKFSVADVSLNDILKANDPRANIVIKPQDVITVPRAEMVYVIGNVQKAGGFVLNDRKDMSVLQALAMAGGPAPAAAPNKAALLREQPGQTERTEIPLNVTKILQAKEPDVPMLPGDILFIPNSTGKKAGLRAIEAAIQLGTGVIIWR